MMKFMRIHFIFMASLATVLLAGCAAEDRLVLEAIGPAAPGPVLTSPAAGTLVVYSAYETGADFNRRNVAVYSHSDYTVFTSDGTLLQKVHNDTGTIQAGPVAVPLPPGKYSVVARANGYGFVTIPVRIVPQETTVLRLDGGGVWPGEPAVNPTNAVRLPDGLVVGAKAGI
jgi:hypothetical protein